MTPCFSRFKMISCNLLGKSSNELVAIEGGDFSPLSVLPPLLAVSLEK